MAWDLGVGGERGVGRGRCDTERLVGGLSVGRQMETLWEGRRAGVAISGRGVVGVVWY